MPQLDPNWVASIFQKLHKCREFDKPNWIRSIFQKCQEDVLQHPASRAHLSSPLEEQPGLAGNWVTLEV